MVGMGDGVSFGLTDALREKWGLNDYVDKGSWAYFGGRLSGNVVGMYVVGSGAGGLWNSCAGRAIRIPGRKPQYLRIESGKVFFLPSESVTKIWGGKRTQEYFAFSCVGEEASLAL
jgi:hypothetical protein